MIDDLKSAAKWRSQGVDVVKMGQDPIIYDKIDGLIDLIIDYQEVVLSNLLEETPPHDILIQLIDLKLKEDSDRLNLYKSIKEQLKG